MFNSTEQKKSQGLQVWITSLNLLAEDNQAIQEGKWLSDRGINAAQELLNPQILSLADYKMPCWHKTCNSQLKEKGLCKFYMFRGNTELQCQIMAAQVER